jgi:hypothetical protein
MPQEDQDLDTGAPPAPSADLSPAASTTAASTTAASTTAASTVTGSTAAAESPAAGSAPPAGRRPWWVWAVPFAAIFGILVARNQFLFSTRLYEDGDSGANSILIQQALRFRLLVGNYSREGFNHPGPAYLYAQALGQWLSRDVLHIVPTDWNGQLLSVFALAAVFVALAVGVVYGWTRSVRGAAACLAVILALVAAHPQVIDSGWMPYMYIPTFFVFLLAAASVAARRVDDLWVLTLSGWFLIHGQACFLFFVPVIAGSAAVAAAWPARRRLRAATRAFFRDHRRAWISAAVISAVFLTPIVINLILHWPGDFGKYFAYGNSAQAGGHSARQVLRYGLWFWWPYGHAWLMPLMLGAVAVAVTATLARGPLRRFLVALLGINAVASLAFVFYTAVGIDDLSQSYIGFFYWSVPFLTGLVIVVGLVQAARQRAATPLIALGTAAVLAAVAVGAALRTSISDDDPRLPAVVAAVAARSPRRPIVIHIVGNNPWPDVTGFLVQAERTGVQACVDSPSWEFMMSAQFICTPRQAVAGARYDFLSPAPPAGTPVVVHFDLTTVTPGIGLVS